MAENPPNGGPGLIGKLAAAALDRVTGAMNDEDKAEILTDLVDELHNLNVSLDFWSVVLTNWSRCGGKSVAALQTCIRDTLNVVGDPWAESPESDEGEEEDEGEGGDDGTGPEEPKPDNAGQVIEADYERVR